MWRNRGAGPGSDRSEREGLIRQRLNDGQVPRVIDDPVLHRYRDKAIATCIDQFEANTGQMPATFASNSDCRSDLALWKVPANKSSGAASTGRRPTGRKREPTPCSPPNAASKTTDGPTSSIGGPSAPQPSDQKK